MGRFDSYLLAMRIFSEIKQTNNKMTNNKLIAEFMGINVVTEDDIRANKNPTISSYEGYLEEDLEYHSSWDWLMPVVKKCMITGDNTDYWDDIFDALSLLSINAVYEEVVEFIKRTNLNKQYGRI